MYDYGICIRYIKSGLYDGRAHKHVYLLFVEPVHDVLQRAAIHLSMGKLYICIWHEASHIIRKSLYAFDPVVHIVYLTMPCKLSGNRLPGKLPVIFHDIGLYRPPVHRRLLKQAHVSDSNKTHMECSRDRRRRQCQNIHIGLHLFYLLFVIYTESLFLIYYEKSQILELHIL